MSRKDGTSQRREETEIAWLHCNDCLLATTWDVTAKLSRLYVCWTARFETVEAPFGALRGPESPHPTYSSLDLLL